MAGDEPAVKKFKTKSGDWRHATVDDDAKRMTCNFCHQERALNITKFSNHLKKCEAYLATTRNERDQFKSTALYGACVEQTKANVRMLLTKAILSANVSFTFIENDYLLEAMRILRVDLPCYTTFRTKAVDEVHDEATKWIKEQINESLFVSVRFDSFKTESNHQVSSVTVKTMGKTIFFRSVNQEDSRANAPYYASIVTKILNEIGKFTNNLKFETSSSKV